MQEIILMGGMYKIRHQKLNMFYAYSYICKLLFVLHVFMETIIYSPF